MFSAPIPGQSLTSEPKNYAWENPPEYSAPEDALLWHMKRLKEPKKVESIAGLLTLGLDVVTMTEGILRGAVAEGRHTVDVSMIIAPVIHEYIVGVAEAADLDFNEGLDEEGFDMEGLEYSIRSKQAEEILESIDDGEEVDLAPMQEPESMEEEVVEEEMPEQPMGLMARRT